MVSIVAVALAATIVPPACCQQQMVVAPGPEVVSLTVYNQNFGLVRETRTLDLQEGLNWVRVEDVAAQIDPTSVHLKGLELPSALSVREQNYEYDLISPEAILRKAVGEHVIVRNYLQNGEVQMREGTLLNGEVGNLVVEGPDGVVLRPTGEVSLRELPEGLISRPALTWKLLSERAGRQRAELSYMTQGISWVANYVAVINEANTKLDLNGWVTLNNGSGASYSDADLQLIAGDVRRVEEAKAGMAMGGMERAEAEGAFEEKAFFEYHLYTMTEPTTIRDKETKQLGLLAAADVPVEKQFVYDGAQSWWQYWSRYRGYGGGEPGAGRDTSDYHKVNVLLELQNSEENHMGMALPKGTVRCYMADDRGRLQFLGEDEIDHTPRDEKIRLHIGDAFDVVGEHRRTDFVKLGPGRTEEAFEIKVRNHKEKEDVLVHVVEHVVGDWRVLEKSHDYTEKDAHTLDFPVRVPPDGEVVVTYRVRIQW